MMSRILSRCPLTFAFDGFISSLPSYLRMFHPRKSNPSLMCVTFVFSGDRTSPRSQKFDNDGLYLMFQPFFGSASNNEVVCVAHHVHFQTCRLGAREFLRESRFKPVKCHVCQNRTDDTPLRGAGFCREEFVLIYVSRLEPFL